MKLCRSLNPGFLVSRFVLFTGVLFFAVEVIRLYSFYDHVFESFTTAHLPLSG